MSADISLLTRDLLYPVKSKYVKFCELRRDNREIVLWYRCAKQLVNTCTTTVLMNSGSVDVYCNTKTHIYRTTGTNFVHIQHKFDPYVYTLILLRIINPHMLWGSRLLRKVAVKEGKDWDHLIPPLLFAYREVPHESTEFSPFELLYWSCWKSHGVVRNVATKTSCRMCSWCGRGWRKCSQRLATTCRRHKAVKSGGMIKERGSVPFSRETRF